MNIKNCSLCGKIYQYVVGENICPKCKEEREEKFQEIKEFIRANGSVPIAVVAETFDIEEKVLRLWVREERLVFEDGGIAIECEHCGAPIYSGRLCEKCKVELGLDFKAEFERSKPRIHEQQVIKDSRRKEEMHFLGKGRI